MPRQWELVLEKKSISLTFLYKLSMKHNARQMEGTFLSHQFQDKY